MRIALVHDWLTGMRGGEKCLEVLCRRFPDAHLYTLLHVPGATSAAIDRMPITTSFLQRLPGVRRYYRWLLPLMPLAIQRLRIPAHVDLVVSLSHAVAKGVIPPPGVPHVCYCFTPMRYAWHRRQDYCPPTAGKCLGLPSAVKNSILDRVRSWDRATSQRVTHFVAISQTVAGRIAQAYQRDSQVVYPPVDTDFYTPADTPREDWYLCVSALVPYKRIDLAIGACDRLGRRLVIIGDGPEQRRLARLAGPGVELLGWRSNEEIRERLYRCRALLFPANEDFGIVPLEAQACGTPVVAFGQGGATETVLPARQGQPGTGWLFGQQTVESLAEAILRCESESTWFDPRLARCNAERFATPRFEQELIAYLTQVAVGQRTRFPLDARTIDSCRLSPVRQPVALPD